MITRARRLTLIFATFLAFVLGGLLVRVAWLQLATGEAAAARQARLSQGSQRLLARRGALLDRHGQVLADSAQALQVTAYSPRITHNGSRPRRATDVLNSIEGITTTLGPILNLPASEIAPALVARRADGRGLSTRIGRPVSDSESIDQLLAEQRPGRPLARLEFEPSWVRRHPGGTVAGNLLGLVLADGQGGSGLELGLQQHLSLGVDGRLPFRAGVAGFRVANPDAPDLDPLDGVDVELTIDMALQRMVEEELGLGCQKLSAVGGAAVLLDVQTGDILAMASAPSLDPQEPRTWSDAAQVIRPVQTVYSPGSTWKPIMLAAALDLGLVRPDERVNCSPERGRIPGRSKPVRDTHPTTGEFSLKEILIESSNVGMANILIRLVEESRPKDTAAMAPLYQILRGLGVGTRTGVPIKAEAAGSLTELSTWTRPYSLVALSFGHELTVTPLQMAAAAATLAQGVHRTPRLVRAYLDDQGRRLEAPFGAAVQVLSPTACDWVRYWMQAVVEEGQAGSAKVPGVSVAGKTGTTVHETEMSAHDPRKKRETHSFIALAPAQAPRVALVVVIEQPRGHRYAAQTVAPVTGAILRRALPYLGLTAP
ncbi:MAG: peptidoglycan D,D-transpeptidase FtsI family protein [Planctomycetota bacterium]